MTALSRSAVYALMAEPERVGTCAVSDGRHLVLDGAGRVPYTEQSWRWGRQAARQAVAAVEVDHDSRGLLRGSLHAGRR